MNYCASNRKKHFIPDSYKCKDISVGLKRNGGTGIFFRWSENKIQGVALEETASSVVFLLLKMLWYRKIISNIAVLKFIENYQH